MLYLVEILEVTLTFKHGTPPGTWAKLVPAVLARYRFLCLEGVPECELIDVYLCFLKFLFTDS